MPKLKRTALIIIYTLVSALLASAQQAQRPQVSTVNVTPEAGRVRVAPVGPVSDLRLEVVNESGETIFEAAQGAREQIDWDMKDSAGARVAPGTYTVTVSYTTHDGKARKRIEQVLLTDERTTGGGAKETSAAATGAPNPQPLVDGGGAANRVPKFTDTDTLTSSVITDVAGRVGIGTTAPAAGLRLDIKGNMRLTPSGGSGGYMQFGTPSGETGLTWLKPASTGPPALPSSRADIRFDGHWLTLAAAVGSGIPHYANGIVIHATGNVSIGGQTHDSKLNVNGGNSVAVWTQSNTTALRGFGDKTAGVYGDGNGAGVFGESFSSAGWGVYGRNRAGGFAGFFDGKVHVAGAFTYSSDRDMKANFSAADPRSILRKLAALPVQTWNYKSEGANVRHLGPVAQDFRAAFGLGADDKSIAAADASGVALASIQALYQLMQEKDRKIERLQARLRRLERAARQRREGRPRPRR